MPQIEDIELTIRDLIRVNELIVNTYDSQLLCSNYENTKNNLKQLYNSKKELTDSLERLLNEFFDIKLNFFTKRIKFTSFGLIPTLISYEFKFNVPVNIDRTSEKYFCYISLMNRLSKEYEVITNKNDDYYFFDITSGLDLDKFFKKDLFSAKFFN